MTDVLELLTKLRDQGIHLWAEGTNLRYRTNCGPLSTEAASELRAHKGSILSLLTGGNEPERLSLPQIPDAERNGPLAVSFSQQRLWFLMQADGVSEAYHITLALHLRGPLREHALRLALNRLVERHETLRTRFEEVNGEVYQRIDPSDVGFSLRGHDLSGVPGEAEDRLSALMAQEASAPFDLRCGPPVRGRLIRIAQDHHVLLITLHHINGDGWSVGVLARDLSRLYSAALRGESAELEPLRAQYADYAAWQRQWLSGSASTEQNAYWREALTGAPAVLELPTDRPRPRNQGFAGDVVVVEIDEALTAALKALSQRQGTTLFMTLLAGWAVVLMRLSGQDDLVIGTPTANRTRTDVEGLIGLFLNTLALRIRVSGEATVLDLLGCVKTAALEAQEHQELPFDQVVEALNPTRNPAHTPLFQVMFAWQNNEASAFELPGLAVTPLEMPTVAAKYDLTLDLEESAGRISGTLNYATALLDRATADRHVGYFRQALLQMCLDVRLPIGKIDILTAGERDRLLHTWNSAFPESPDERCIHELFEEQARRAPRTLAVVHGDTALTYADLNCKANQLARYLRARGVGPDQVIAVCLERGIELAIGLLAVLKAGGAYLPLDPEYPLERLRFMVIDAQPRLLLTQERIRQAVSLPIADVVTLDTDWGAAADNEDENLPPASLGLSCRNLAFVIYTSGSTGLPKGAMNEHRGMVNRLLAQQHFEAYRSTDVACQKTSVSFVDAVFELFGPLCAGVPVVIIPAAAVINSTEMAALIARHRISHLTTVPSLAQSMLESMQIMRDLAGLRIWTLSGEEVRPALLTQLQERLPGCEFIVQYGSSEVSSDAAIHRVRDFSGGSRVPIGHPVPRCTVYVLDRYRQPVPTGVVGEIYVGGIGVGRGYRNRPELTSERFSSDPFSLEPEARLYRTGDLGRWRADGVLECLGRKDHQVKIRGFRVELGEIEVQLARHEQVRSAVVVARAWLGLGSGEKRLVAYIVGRSTGPVSAEALRAYLKSTLPEFMIPSAFMLLDRLPLTPNGKLDRNALPEPGSEALVSRAYEAPQGDVEEGVAEIWQQLLHLERVGRHDNFFELGGHSLHFMKLIARVTDRFGVRPSVPGLFQATTLADLARLIESLTLAKEEPSFGEEMEVEEGTIEEMAD